VYYVYTKSPKEKGMDLKSSRIVELGNLVGDHFSAMLRKAGILVDYRNEKGKIPLVFGKPCEEFPIRSEKLGITFGFIDGVIVKEGVLTLAEYKSIGNDGYTGLSEPKPEHLIQGVTYLKVFNLMLRQGKFKHIKELDDFIRAEGITFLYYNKNTSYIKEFYIPEEDSMATFKEVVDRILYIQALNADTPLPEKTSFFCNGCAYQKRCEADQYAPRHGGEYVE